MIKQDTMNFKGTLFVVSLILYRADAITLYCSKSADGLHLIASFRNVKTAGVIERLQAIDTTTAATSGCISTEKTVDSVDTLELNITVSLSSKQQISPEIGTHDCYVVVTEGTPDVYSFSVVAQKNAGTSVADDDIFTGDCDSDTPTPVQDIGSSGLLVVNTITPTDITAEAPSLVAKLVDNSGADITASVNIGDRVRLRVTYTPPAGLTDGEGVVGVQITNVLLSGYSDFRSTFQLITVNGCINQTTAAILNMVGGFAYSAADSVPATPEYVFQSDLFDMPLPDGPAPKKLYVKLSFNEICLTLTDNRCADQEQHCVDYSLDRDQKRKRRAAVGFEQMSALKRYSLDASVDMSREKRSTTEDSRNGTLQFAIPIKLYEGGKEARSGGTDDKSEELCKVPDMYWIISVVLAVLLLGTMALCIFLVLRLRREQNQNDKMAEKLGHRNPGYY